MTSRLRTTVPPVCPPRTGDKISPYAAIVDHYIKCKRPLVNAERRVYEQRSLKDAIHYAGLAKLPNGNRHPHQYRIKPELLAEAERKLQKIVKRLQACETFAELHDVIFDEIRCKGLSVTTIYDTANYIGANLGLEPEEVYLHAGTRTGAKILGLGRGRQTIKREELPPEFKRLKPRECEDCLCSYKNDLAAIG